jgi:hypothetical protein
MQRAERGVVALPLNHATDCFEHEVNVQRLTQTGGSAEAKGDIANVTPSTQGDERSWPTSRGLWKHPRGGGFVEVVHVDDNGFGVGDRQGAATIQFREEDGHEVKFLDDAANQATELAVRHDDDNETTPTTHH